jgi:hypothetical protein
MVKEEAKKLLGPVQVEDDDDEQEILAMEQGGEESGLQLRRHNSDGSDRAESDGDAGHPIDRSYFESLREPTRHTRPSAEDMEVEINKFLNDPGTRGKIEPETFGVNRVLLQLFLKTNAPLPSSAAVERLFSLAGRIFVPLRANLNPETFSQLLFLRANQHLYNLQRGVATPLAKENDSETTTGSKGG